MPQIVGVTFKEDGEVINCLIGSQKPKKNITVIVDTNKGLQFGKVVTNIKDVKDVKEDLPKMIRISSKNDYYNHKKNVRDAKEALLRCKKIVAEKQMKMQIVDATYTFDRNQLIFRFVADSRIDFRDLAKDLAAIYKTRIELRQIGIRDKAKEVGGLGLCGRPMCCAKFLKEFDSVSISMAKNQNISLNPNKINGVCGRLLCCLKYEDECYKKCKKCLPNVGAVVKTKEGEGKVISVDILNQKYTVNIENVGTIEVSKENGTESSTKL